MNKYTQRMLALGALTVGLAACNNGSSHTIGSVTTPTSGFATQNPSNPPASTATYVQIELLARPAVKEVFENFNDHKTTNGVEPYAGTAGGDPLQAEIKSTEDTIRPANAAKGTDYGAGLQGLLYPNEYMVALGDTTDKASYLGVETGGATGGKFGGRDLSDDVVGISLGALFGNTLSKLGVLADDGEENNCISTENLPAPNASQAKQASFPYLASPH